MVGMIIIMIISLLLCPSTDCLLGPVDDDLQKDRELEGVSPLHMPPALSHSHPNAFHVWDQDDVIIPMTPSNESPLASPLMSVIPYIPSFFPNSLSIGSPSYNQPIPKESDAWSRRIPRQFLYGAFFPLGLGFFCSWAYIAPCFYLWNTFYPCTG